MDNTRNFYFFAILSLAIVISTACARNEDAVPLQVDSNDTEQRIASLQTQVQNMTATLTALERADAVLKDQIDSTNNANVKAASDSLSKAMNDLRKYIDEAKKEGMDWASGTYATLEQYDKLCIAIAAAGKALEPLDTLCYQIAIEAIDSVETTMKIWVNEKLTGYWSIEQTQAELNSLREKENADVSELSAELQKVKSDVTEGYRKTIEESIVNLNGILTDTLEIRLVGITDTLNTRLDDLNARVTKLEQDLKAYLYRVSSMEEQHKAIDATIKNLQSADNALEELIYKMYGEYQKLKTDVTSNSEKIAVLESLIADTKATSTQVKQDIDTLRNYINNELPKINVWMNATFATLTNFESLCSTVAKAEVDAKANEKKLQEISSSILNECAQLVDESLKQTEESLKTWVNEKLSSEYWTVAQAQAELNNMKSELIAAYATELSKERGDISGQLDEDIQKWADELASKITDKCEEKIDEAMASVKTTYEGLISAAITNYNSKINADLVKKIEDAEDELTTRIKQVNEFLSTIRATLTSIGDRIDKANADLDKLVAGIQSIALIPTRDDGSWIFAHRTTETLPFRVEPVSIATELAQKWSSDRSILSMTYHTTPLPGKTFEEKSGSFKINSVKVSSEGLMEVMINRMYDSIPRSFKRNQVGVSACLSVKSTGCEISSSYFPVVWDIHGLKAKTSSTFQSMMSVNGAQVLEVEFEGTTYSGNDTVIWTASNGSIRLSTRTTSLRNTITADEVGYALITASCLGYTCSFPIITIVPYQALPYTYSVSNSRYVCFYFSNENAKFEKSLLYSFDHPYDFVGNAKPNTEPEESRRCPDVTGIDLLSWAAGNATCTHSAPWWSLSTNDTDYKTTTFPASAGETILTFAGTSTTSYDGTEKRLMMESEWRYLLYSRPDASKKYGFAKIEIVDGSGHVTGYKYGLIILPDNFRQPYNPPIFVPAEQDSRFEANFYYLSDWNIMSGAGAVFLPCAGIRDGYTVTGVDTHGYYWMSEATESTTARCLHFYEESSGGSCRVEIISVPRHKGCSIRRIYNPK